MRGQAWQGGWQASSGAWAPAGRCSAADNALHPEPLGPRSRSARCAAASSPRAPGAQAALPPASLGSGHGYPRGSRAPGRAEAGHQDEGPACRAKALLSTLPEEGYVQVLHGLKPQCLGLGSLSFSSRFWRCWSCLPSSRPDAVSSLCLLKRFNSGAERTVALPQYCS